MEPGTAPLVNVTNTYFTIPKQENKDLSEFYAPFMTHAFTDRAVNGTQVYITNMTFDNLQANRWRILGLETGPESYVYIKDLTFKNIRSFVRTFHIVNGKIAYLENLNIIN